LRPDAWSDSGAANSHKRYCGAEFLILQIDSVEVFANGRGFFVVEGKATAETNMGACFLEDQQSFRLEEDGMFATALVGLKTRLNQPLFSSAQSQRSFFSARARALRSSSRSSCDGIGPGLPWT